VDTGNPDGMTAPAIRRSRDGPVATILLDDPDRRNALGTATFDALDDALASIAGDDDVRVVLIGGAGAVFCAGFDLSAAAADPDLVGQLILRLGRLTRSLRRLPQPVVVAAQGAAIAGGCAIASAADFVCASPRTKFGYPVHRIGISPVVSYPTLAQAAGAGPARTLLLRGDLIDGAEAHRIGLVTHLAETDAQVPGRAGDLCRMLAGHSPGAMRATKAWLNELDGSSNDDRFDAPAGASASAACAEEAARMLREAWPGADPPRHR
jgi:enoyl-CoA hydratase/carnithine racemase